MIELGPIWLLRPWWLVLIVMLLPAALLVWRRRARAGVWARVVDAELMMILRRFGHVVSVPASVTIAAGIAISAIAILALSGPARRDAAAPSFSNLEGIVVIVDMSASVARSAALDDAKAAAARVMQEAGGRAVALVAFAGEAYALSAFTTDPGALETMIAALDASTMPDVGSRADRGLELAYAMLRNTRIKGGDVFLISDGGGLGPLAKNAAAEIQNNGARLHGIFVQPDEPAYGAPPPSRNALAALIESGRGDMLSILSISDALESARSGADADATLAHIAFQDFGRYLLGLAIFPAIILFRRRI